MPGLFVTFEGGEGSGKSTQIARLATRLREFGRDPLLAREPGGTPVAEGVRAVLLDHDACPVALAEAFLLQAARAQLVETVLRPALAAGRVVICDRYADSTLAYQGAGRGLDVAMLASWNQVSTGGLTPDLTLLLDLPADLGLARRAAAAPGGGNRIDREPVAFHARVREYFLLLARREPSRWLVLDATGTADAIADAVWRAVEPRLAALSR